MWSSSHVRSVCKNGVNIQMGSANYASAVERWDSNCWEDDLQTGVVSTEDTDEVWKSAKEESTEKVRGRANRTVRADSPMTDEVKVEKSF